MHAHPSHSSLNKVQCCNGSSAVQVMLQHTDCAWPPFLCNCQSIWHALILLKQANTQASIRKIARPARARQRLPLQLSPHQNIASLNPRSSSNKAARKIDRLQISTSGQCSRTPNYFQEAAGVGGGQRFRISTKATRAQANYTAFQVSFCTPDNASRAVVVNIGNSTASDSDELRAMDHIVCRSGLSSYVNSAASIK